MRASWTPPEAWSDEGARGARRRAGGALAALAAGIVLGRFTPDAPLGLWFTLGIAAAGVGCAGRGWVCRGALLAAVASIGAGWTQARVHTRAPDSLGAMMPEAVGGLIPPKIVRLECRAVSSAAEVAAPRTILDVPTGASRSGWFEAEALRVETDAGWLTVSGLVRVSAPGLRDEHFAPGRRVRVTGWVRPVEPSPNPGGWDGRAWARQRGLVGEVRMASPALIESVEEGWIEGAWSAPTRWRGLVRRRTGAAFESADGEGAALMGALLLGRRDPELRPAYERFRRLGAAHLLAVSGFHLAVLAGLALWAVRLSGERGRIEGVLVAGATLAYMLVLPARTPIVRAGVMVLGILAGEAAARRPDRLASLAWIACALLVWRPLDLWSIGFQLSVGVTALLIWLGAMRHPWVYGTRVVGAPGGGGVSRRIADSVRRTLVVCLLCWMVAAPTILAHTGVASPIAPLASAALLPLVLVDLAAGFVLVIGAAVVPALGGVAAAALAGLGDATLWTAALLERVPGASFLMPTASAAWAAAATLWVLWLVGRARMRDPRVWVVGVALGVWLVGEATLGRRPGDAVVVRMDTFSVDDGTCHLIRAGGDAVLWDAGSLSRGWATGSILDAWRALGGVRVETAVVSHPNLDHYNALPELVGPLGVRRVLVSDAMLERTGEGVPGAWRQMLEARGVHIERIGAGDEVRIGGATLRVLADGSAGGAGLAVNDRSLVARLEAPTETGTRRVLLTGDIGPRGIELLEAGGADVRADVLELPHHGSVHAGALDFVERVSPSVVVQSTGPGRALDRRWESVRDGRVWWTTAVQGACWVEMRRDGSIVTGAELNAGDYLRPAR